jgi:predicted metalloendopeptidase
MRHRRWQALLAFIATWLAIVAVAPIAAQQSEEAVHHGINPADMDLSVDPDANFYRFANGGWLDRATIPGDWSSWGPMAELIDLTERQQLALLDRLAKGSDLREGSDEWKAVRLFDQATDLTARNGKGISPIQPTLDEIDAIQNLDEFHRFLVDAPFKGVAGLFGLGVDSDLEDSTIWAAYVGGPALGLPNRDYYLEEQEGNQEVREAYIATSAALLGFIGYDAARGAAAAQAVYDLEKRLAEPTLTREEQQDFSLINNRMTLAELEQAYPPMDWAAYIDTLGLTGVERYIVTEARYLNALEPIVNATPLDALKDALRLQILWGFSGALSEEIEATAFEFWGRVLGGLTEMIPPEESALYAVSGVLGDAVGKLYVAEHFPPEAKAQIETLVAEVLKAFRHRLERNSWMSQEAKAEALDKLSKVIVKVGYPDTWRTYEAVEIKGSYAETLQSAGNAEYQRWLARVGQPVDKTEWFIPPQVVNAFYNPSENSISFPAAILQPPFFDHLADPASNFGAIGAIIGHEITHGFDFQGSQFDADGNLRSWWTAEDDESFAVLNDRVAAQYGAIEVLPGLFVDGQITVTENVADMGGVRVAYEAMENYLALTERPDKIDGFTQEQRFFIAYAAIWREKIRSEALETQVKADPHAPAHIRATQPLLNTDAFFAVFDVRPGDGMWLPPEERVTIW